jgi:GR25 family glycosyltransferase involved in LPS biosynthesis
VSHVRLLHRAVAEDWDHGIIFEDDAVVVPEFAKRLQEVLCDLPHDWDVLMLNGASSSPPMQTCLYPPCTQTAVSA